MCDFIAGSRRARRSRTGAQYFDEFRSHFWERPEDEFDRIRSINTLNRRRSRGNGNITLAPSTREVERELKSSERRISRSPRRQLPSVSQRRTASRPSNNDNMDIVCLSKRMKDEMARLQHLNRGTFGTLLLHWKI
ncbi:hypothetical protein RhiirA5_355989 [Rhizophagus irregularis]|uniref:Uncharacterized protein n=2 Tax=Rhizophagus irregularis TaxID=588596 RepID=U9V1B7_RHIID|nr:hypothetical protein GLOIN_2v1471093 [Rhizophagus irregularis DAOM 181602=DAOM 197198]PKC10054.1 hypothetical protein RhiirA5_355989 [Rhizophagus irregularis]PKC58782.1 hypothetical protein RhiirA1_427468 [Rhizophagus irregularis]PKC64319.1 hypothetical protein RhiirA1_421741 [Rhizophagus irregularis]PKY29522.1 hypothetical protein RhiirB3_418079 [Rhizophagus irregularis]POG81144.1 hypothetical protein GLOIN_2v1471093 [Rhizophagus irregularis DAOM 181602=DAOM 197198]|eukprot:XP_025188010.1 hypothetical protein GLOIN_2v1471093 [Rhizophagus irregularis DAOM 181602=DAOM 197198]